MTLSGATTPGQSGPGSHGNDGVLCIPQSSSITGVSPSDCLVSYPGHSSGESYPSAEMQKVYSTAPANWATLGKTINVGDKKLWIQNLRSVIWKISIQHMLKIIDTHIY